MLRLRLPRGLIGALFAVLLVASPAHGSIVQALGLEELVEHADRIVLGRVLSSESFQLSDGELGTWCRIQVERDIGGAAPDETEVIVETLGGRIGNLAMQVEGEPSFSVGERVIVFVRGGGPYRAFRPVGMGQGVMRVRKEQGIETVTQSRRGMMLMRRGSDGHWQKSLGALPEAEGLETFIERVRAIAEQQAGGLQ
ncbi:MAG: hypothetical protein WAU39_18625 [Polyangiales bacterium]